MKIFRYLERDIHEAETCKMKKVAILVRQN